MVEGKEQMMVESFYRVKGEAGLLAIPLPENLPLERGFVYRWRFAVQCEGAGIDYVEGNLSLEPEEISADLLASLAGATQLERAEVYLTQGWWYDAVKQLLLILQRNDSTIYTLWLNLLKQENLNEIITEKL